MSPDDPSFVADVAVVGAGAAGLATAIFVAFFLASAVVILRTGALPRWVGWLGLVTAAASVLGIEEFSYIQL